MSAGSITALPAHPPAFFVFIWAALAALCAASGAEPGRRSRASMAGITLLYAAGLSAGRLAGPSHAAARGGAEPAERHAGAPAGRCPAGARGHRRHPDDGAASDQRGAPARGRRTAPVGGSRPPPAGPRPADQPAEPPAAARPHPAGPGALHALRHQDRRGGVRHRPLQGRQRLLRASRRAIACCATSPTGSRPRCAARTRWPASAATSSPWWRPTSTDGGETTAVAQRLLDACRPPFDLGDGRVQVTISIGAAVFPEHGRDADALLRAADAALYLAKGAGKDRVALYSQALHSAQEFRRRLEAELRHAAERGEFDLAYQPTVRPREPPPDRRRGAAALAAPGVRRPAHRPVHRGRRGQRADRRHRPLGAGCRLRAGAGAGATPAIPSASPSICRRSSSAIRTCRSRSPTP